MDMPRSPITYSVLWTILDALVLPNSTNSPMKCCFAILQVRTLSLREVWDMIQCYPNSTVTIQIWSSCTLILSLLLPCSPAMGHKIVPFYKHCLFRDFCEAKESEGVTSALSLILPNKNI